jgi:hypothetical protein
MILCATEIEIFYKMQYPHNESFSTGIAIPKRLNPLKSPVNMGIFYQ